MAVVKTEADLREVVRAAFLSVPGVHQSWIETHATCAGFPDLEVCYFGSIHHVELKVTGTKGEIGIRPTQYRWFRDSIKAGGEPFLWVHHDGEHYIFKGSAVYEPDVLTKIAQADNRLCWIYSTAEQAARHILR